MILRKPYAFLIKHFKMLHLILTVCMVYLIYKTEMMISFLNEYIDSTTSVLGQPIVSSLYTIGVIILPILILVFSVTLLVIMTIKEKPRMYYILMIVVHVAIIASYFYGYSVFHSMENTVVSLRIIKTLRDIFLYCILGQGIFSIISLVRGVGFDIKKFDFGVDLQNLEISEEDNEEFEIDIDFDLNDKTRKGKRILRFLRYKYKEHKFVARIIMGILATMLLFYTYSHYNIYYKTSPEGTNFHMNGFTLGADKSYIVNETTTGTLIGNGSTSLVVVDLNIKNNSKYVTPLALGSVELRVGNHIYHHTDQYETALLDLGIVYKNQNIGSDYTHYLLVYEIPTNKTNSKLKLGFTNSHTNETAYIRLQPKKMSGKDSNTKEYTVGDTLSFEDSTLGSSALKIASYDIQDRFKINYRYCTTRLQNCLDSVEYIMPQQYNTNYDKALLKLELELSLDEKYKSTSLKDISSLLKSFGRIEYEINGQKKVQSVYLGEVKSKKASKNTYYLEVYREIMNADKIALVFQIRNNTYKYYLK